MGEIVVGVRDEDRAREVAAELIARIESKHCYEVDEGAIIQALLNYGQERAAQGRRLERERWAEVIGDHRHLPPEEFREKYGSTDLWQVLNAVVWAGWDGKGAPVTGEDKALALRELVELGLILPDGSESVAGENWRAKETGARVSVTEAHGGGMVAKRHDEIFAVPRTQGPDESHQMGEGYAETISPMGTPRVYERRDCSRCGGSDYSHPAGYFVTEALLAPCVPDEEPVA